MDGTEYNQTGQEFEEILIKLRDLEEKQRLTKDRLLLISQNLLEIKEKSIQDILGIKKDLQIMKQNMNRLMNFIETASSEFSKFAKKEDLEILSKQAKMFQPLKLEKSTKQ
ncbi:MAG TPA: hypothetical protein HA283_05570 [Nanoarchaeota archaeon]|nr:hypothetical protein [Nanoarchaeota archaeon]HIH63737.1 hypothetical protein [Nanoarchaeota archaeon]HIJ09610.1 hypothetical protein [Nanoarchaeota archaeon]